ncbi:MAG: Minf_1886 family protein, partial [Chthoniobacterales bacterium]
SWEEPAPPRKQDPKMQNVSFTEALDAVITHDPRYGRDAYVFLRDALDFTLKKRRKARREDSPDAPAAELLDGFRLLALKEYGPMSSLVLDSWGVRSCEDVGNLVFNLVEAGVFSKTDSDTPEEFRNGYDFDEAFLAPFRPQQKRLSAKPGRVVERGS